MPSFSERNGLVEPPPQLKLGEVSDSFRRQLEYIFLTKLEECSIFEYNLYLNENVKRFLKDLSVKHFDRSIDKAPLDYDTAKKLFQTIAKEFKYNHLFDFIEFCAQHPFSSGALSAEVRGAFIETRQAYRLSDNGKVIAVGTAEQAEAFQAALESTSAAGIDGARQHLLNAGIELRNGNWARSVHESINSVEAVARRLASDATGLALALKVLEKQGALHPALSKGFSALYGYTSDAEGVRHAMVFQDKPELDEADALFMFGACASFVTYLLARTQ